MQHMDNYDDRKAKIDIAVAMVKDAVDTLKAEGLDCDIVGGGGTGSYYFESTSGVYNELQCGSYAFMDADYGRILDKDGNRIDQGEWENALFILTSVMSHAKADKAIVDAGLKAQSVDSGLPVIFGRTMSNMSNARTSMAWSPTPWRPQGERQAAPCPRPLRPDLQRARLVCRRAQRQGRNRLAGLRARQGLLMADGSSTCARERVGDRAPRG
jgi:hypothetical protein